MKKLLLPLMILTLFFPSAIPALAGEKEPPTPTPRALAEELSLEAPPPRWQQLLPPTSPSPRTDHAMAYDTARGVAVLFGGHDGASYLDDTWEWASAAMTWTERFPAHRPAPRLGHAMVYDAARRLTVLFGGITPVAQENNETWVWDGTDWTQLFPANAPAPRWLPSMAYDCVRQVAVLFGGDGCVEECGDTWEWDGTDWTEQLIPSPSARAGASMAYDANRNVTVLFGGDNGAQFFNDSWERAGDGP